MAVMPQKKPSVSTDKNAIANAIANNLEYYRQPNHNSIRSIANHFGIKEFQLRHAIKNGLLSHQGPATVLTPEEEEELVGYCLNMQRIGFGLTKSTIDTILEMIKLSGHNHPFSKSG